MAISDVCALWIEQEIDAGLKENKTADAIGKEVSKAILKVFQTKVKPAAIKKRAQRQKQKNEGTNVPAAKTPKAAQPEKDDPPLFDRDGKPNVPNKVQQFSNLQKRLEHLNADIKGLTDSGIDGNAIVGIGIQIKFLITWFKGLSYNKEQEKEKADGK